MFRIIKEVFIALLSFSRSLASKCVSLNNEPCMVSHLCTDINPVELKYYPSMISLNKCIGSCNSVDDLSTKICVPSKTKDVNVQVFNMITNRNEAETMVKYIPCDWICKFNSTTCNSDQKWNNETCQCECKNYRTCKKDYSWNPSTCICENGKYLKIIADHLCDETIYAMDIVSTNTPNTIPTNGANTTKTNVKSTVSTIFI